MADYAGATYNQAGPILRQPLQLFQYSFRTGISGNYLGKYVFLMEENFVLL